jgi:hypothetical protein
MYYLVVLATGVICLFTSLVGYTGIMLNNRAILTFYNLLLWPCFGIIAAIGYTAYRKNKWNLEGKLSYQWHYKLDSDGRARIQANVSPFHYESYNSYSYEHSFTVVVTSHFQITTKDPINVSLVPYYLAVNSSIRHSQRKH